MIVLVFVGVVLVSVIIGFAATVFLNPDPEKRIGAAIALSLIVILTVVGNMVLNAVNNAFSADRYCLESVYDGYAAYQWRR